MVLDPLILDETSPGVFSLLLRDLDSFASAFEANDHVGCGYSWEALARHVVESSLSELEEKIEFDSEADMFCATSGDRGALAQLGEALAEATRSPKRLAKLIAH